MSKEADGPEDKFTSLEELRREVFPESRKVGGVRGTSEEGDRQFGKVVAKELMEKYKERLKSK